MGPSQVIVRWRRVADAILQAAARSTLNELLLLQRRRTRESRHPRCLRRDSPRSYGGGQGFDLGEIGSISSLPLTRRLWWGAELRSVAGSAFPKIVHGVRPGGLVAIDGEPALRPPERLLVVLHLGETDTHLLIGV